MTAPKLHRFQSGKTMSELVINSLTTTEVIQKALVSTRRGGMIWVALFRLPYHSWRPASQEIHPGKGALTHKSHRCS